MERYSQSTFHNTRFVMKKILLIVFVAGVLLSQMHVSCTSRYLIQLIEFFFIQEATAKMSNVGNDSMPKIGNKTPPKRFKRAVDFSTVIDRLKASIAGEELFDQLKETVKKPDPPKSYCQIQNC